MALTRDIHVNVTQTEESGAWVALTRRVGRRGELRRMARRHSESGRGAGTRAATVAFGMVVVLLLGACGLGAEVAWNDIPVSPGAEPYDGSVEAVLDDRLSGRIAEQGLELVESRVEHLPPGVDWATHRAWRSEHVAKMAEVSDRLDIPEPDAPVAMTRYSDGTSTLFVIARADDSGERLVVLTALTREA